MIRHGRTYTPPPTAPGALLGHRLNDPMYSVLTTDTVTPAQVLDASTFYSYDSLP